MRIFILFFSIGLASVQLQGQSKKYSNCDCTVKWSDSLYQVVSSKGFFYEKGTYSNGKRNGLWESRNTKNRIVRQANYIEGSLDGDYLLFHFNGEPKLQASFEMGKPVGYWHYYNAHGELIKHGKYENGRPVGLWRIWDTKGKVIFADYDFDTQDQKIKGAGKRWFARGEKLVDDQSGQRFTKNHASRIVEVDAQPFGGYLLANDLFIEIFNLPPVFQNSKFRQDFHMKIVINGPTISSIEIDNSGSQTVNKKGHFLPIYLEYRSENKWLLKRYNEANLRFLKDQLSEVLQVIGPWKNTGVKEIDLAVPLSMN